MHIEVRKVGKKKLYYLAYSFRDGRRVRKVRRYLGENLTNEEIRIKRAGAEKSIQEQLENYRRISDPLHTVLSEREKQNIKTLIAKGDILVRHLSEAEWRIFTRSFVYDTNAIEGSTVTAPEVKDIIEKDKWPEKRTKEEISETYGVAEAVAFIRRTKEHLSLELIEKLHDIVFRNSKVFAGKFRGRGIEVAVVDSRGTILHRGAPQNQVAILRKELVKWYDKNKEDYHPIVLASVVHNQFENIHPFQDGNGRVGRLLLNNILLKHDMPPVNIELDERGEYYQALRAYQNNGDIRPTIELILREYAKLKKLWACDYKKAQCSHTH